jgi:hypothetical protein
MSQNKTGLIIKACSKIAIVVLLLALVLYYGPWLHEGKYCAFCGVEIIEHSIFGVPFKTTEKINPEIINWHDELHERHKFINGSAYYSNYIIWRNLPYIIAFEGAGGDYLYWRYHLICEMLDEANKLKYKMLFRENIDNPFMIRRLFYEMSVVLSPVSAQQGDAPEPASPAR